HAADGEGMLILAPGEPVLHLLAGVPPVAPCSYIEMVLVEDYEDLCRCLERQPNIKVYIDKELFERGWRRMGSRRLIDLIQETYELCDETPAGYVFRRGGLLLPGEVRTPCHVGFADGRCPETMRCPPVWLDRAFSLEMILNPADRAEAHRILLSNHCGSLQFQGLTFLEK